MPAATSPGSAGRRATKSRRSMRPAVWPQPGTPTPAAGSSPLPSRARPSTLAAGLAPSAGRLGTTSRPCTRPLAWPQPGTPTRTTRSAPLPSRARPSTWAGSSTPSAGRLVVISRLWTRSPAPPQPGIPTPVPSASPPASTPLPSPSRRCTWAGTSPLSVVCHRRILRASQSIPPRRRQPSVALTTSGTTRTSV